MLKPIGDRLIVKIQSSKPKSKILIIPDHSDRPKQHTCLGYVVAVGDEVIQIKEKDFVFYSREAGTAHPEDSSLLFIKEKDCLLKIKREEGSLSIE